MSEKQTKQQTKEAILEIVRQQNPETAQQLVQEMQARYSKSEKEIMDALLELENEEKLHFTKQEPFAPTSLKAYVFSTKPLWYWTTIALAVATAVSVFTIPEDAYPVVYLRSVLGVIFVLFLPGYGFIKALFPVAVPIKTSSESLDMIERVALSLGMSLALTPIVGLILNYTPWGIRLTPITLSLLMLTIVFATVAVVREHQIKASQIKQP